ncbi:MAG TPA: hypothetical protein VFS83_14665 [Ktedonobacterales bacterium]|nr:hypothetical protein [Ktedonobacterales bacterium]
MIEQDAVPASTDAPVVADEIAVEDAATQIVPQSSLTPPPATPRKPSGPLPSASAPAAAAPPPNPGPQQGWQQGRQQGQPQGTSPHVVPVVAVQRPGGPAQVSHAPWHTSSSWGPTTFVITAETAAGFSYLFWWVSGLLVYFNERENRYVRFHAVQSILLTGALSIFSVFAFTIAALFNDFFQSSHQSFWHTLCIGTIVLSLIVVLLPWLLAMIAAFTGTYLQLPKIGEYAERFAAPPIQLRP